MANPTKPKTMNPKSDEEERPVRYEHVLAEATPMGLTKMLAKVNERSAEFRLVTVVRLETAIVAVLERMDWKPRKEGVHFFE